MKIFSKILEEINEVLHDAEIRVTLYSTYGYEREGQWTIPLRGRVHQSRRLPDEMIARLVAKALGFNGPDFSHLTSRSEDFLDDSRSRQEVIIKFDSDPDDEPFYFPTSDLNGLIEREINLSAEKAQRLLDAQGSSEWLTFSVVSSDHNGSGRIRLIGPEGLSVVSDIDDTIKVSKVPCDKGLMLRKALCEPFESAPDMARRYKENWSHASFHYVSGGPWQLYRAISTFLEENGFPAGSFHMNYYPKNFLAEDTREILIDAITGSLGKTFDHKVEQITRLMRNFPRRRFILVGDSGEADPEVYQHVRGMFPGQVQEIWIRDVLNDKTNNQHRFNDIKEITVETPFGTTDEHHEKLSTRLNDFYGVPYNRNTAPPCS